MLLGQGYASLSARSLPLGKALSCSLYHWTVQLVFYLLEEVPPDL